MKKLIIGLLLVTGCTDAQWASVKTLGSKHTIVLYSGSQVVGRFESTGKISESEGGHCAFMDETTHKFIEIYGTYVITQE